MRALLLALLGVGSLALGAFAQGLPANSPVTTQHQQPDWGIGLSLYQYFVPDDDYLQPTLTADRGRLHLEARYNYEDIDTASVWAGYNLTFGEALSLELTPMLGLAFGDSDGAVLGYRGALDWWRLELYSEGEYLHDLEDRRNSYVFTWTELVVMPVEWLRAGIVVQRTRVYEANLDIQRGFLLGLTFDPVSITVDCFNPDQDHPIWILALELAF